MRLMTSRGLGGEREIKVEKKRWQKQEGATQTQKKMDYGINDSEG